MDLVVSPAIVALNTQTGSQKHAMTPGQLIDALVLEFIDATTVRLAVADSVIEVKTDFALVPGSVMCGSRRAGMAKPCIGSSSAPGMFRPRRAARQPARPKRVRRRIRRASDRSDDWRRDAGR